MILGMLIKVLTDPTKRAQGSVYDLCLYDATLIVPRFQDMSSVIYQITVE